MMISPWRSAKWRGTSFQPSEPKKNGSPMSSSRASDQMAAWPSPSRNDATTSNATPTAVPTASPTVERRSAGSSREASMKRAM